LSIVVAAIVTLVITAVGIVNNIMSNHYALESARSVLRFNSESILSGIGELMMNRNNEGVHQLIQDMSRGSSVYRDIRLVSHHAGEVVVSSRSESGAKLSIHDHSCAACHDRTDPSAGIGMNLDEVIENGDGTRVLHVNMPIANEPKCRTAECHAHADSGPLLGFLQTDYSLGSIDSLIFGFNASFVTAGIIAILLCTIALWVMLARTLARPIRHIIAGTRALAANNLSFRFESVRTDELGMVERSFNDMAQRIQAHQIELRETTEYLEGIVESSADMIITVNPRGLIQTINRGAEEILGYERDELVGQRIEVLFADPSERDVAIARLQDQDNVTNFETRFRTKDGEIREVLLTLSRLRDRDGNPVGTFGISKDVTREKNLQERLFQYEKDAAIGQAVTSIQHAIKNMLNTLTGGSYLARQGMVKDNEDRVSDGLNMIDEGISRIQSLSTNMLRYAREWTLELENTDLAALLHNIVSSVKQRADEMDVAVHIDIPDDLPQVSCDERLVHMALMDMATNALDACMQKQYEGGESAQVTFRAYTSSEDEVVIEVQDNGIGMTKETKEKIFTPFFSTKEDWGTGLGLVSTSRIVSLHGGEIHVESAPNEGALFRVILPLWSTSVNQGV
jgi:PAS domain S-box-containing protein